MLLLRNALFLVQKSPCGHVTAQKCHFLGTKKPLRAYYCSEMQFVEYKKACGHVTAHKCIFLGTKKTLRACYCSEMQLFRYKKVPAGMSLLRNAIF